MPYTSLNGHMFSFLTPEGLPALRLSEAQPEDLTRKKQATQTIQHGRVMQEFVDISAALWKNKAVVTGLFDDSFQYTSTLKPKAMQKQAAKKRR